MGDVLSGKRGIVCKSVVSEFKELVSMYAGLNEKQRAEKLLKRLMYTIRLCFVSTEDINFLLIMIV